MARFDEQRGFGAEAARLFIALIVLLAGMAAADYGGSATGSVWISAGVGVLVALVVGYAMGSFERPDELEGRLDQFWARHRVISRTMAFFAILALAGLAAYQIVDSGPDELGFFDYQKSAGGGFVFGILIAAIWTYAKDRKSDATQ